MRAIHFAALTERLRILTVLERVELVRQVRLQFGHLDEGVRRLEPLQLADDAGHFLRGAVVSVSVTSPWGQT